MKKIVTWMYFIALVGTSVTSILKSEITWFFLFFYAFSAFLILYFSVEEPKMIKKKAKKELKKITDLMKENTELNLVGKKKIKISRGFHGNEEIIFLETEAGDKYFFKIDYEGDLRNLKIIFKENKIHFKRLKTLSKNQKRRF